LRPQLDKLERSALLAEVKELVDIAQFIVDEYGVALVPQANGWYNTNCLMPNHRDSRPSFGVNPDLGKYRCLSCNAHGDVIDLVQKVEGLNFVEALSRLANYAGVSTSGGDEARIARIVKQIQRDIDSFLNSGGGLPLPAEMSEPDFMLTVAERLRKHERATGDTDWVDAQYEELDGLLEAQDYKACCRFWSELGERVRSRKKELEIA
jgi:hypothetical protein